MSYQIHIRREDAEISEGEWRQAVSEIDNLRMAQGESVTATNPVTGEEISMGLPPGTAEFRFPEGSIYSDMAGQWIPIFYFSSHGISLNAAFDPDDPDDPVRIVVKALASRLDAAVTGDEGETYEL